MSLKNTLQLIGYLGKPPEVMQNASGRYGYLNIATSYSQPDGAGGWQDVTDWHYCQFGDKLAERLEKMQLQKGDLVTIEGRLSYRKKTIGTDSFSEAVVKLNALELLKRKEPKGERVESQTGKEETEPTGTVDDEGRLAKADDDDLPF